MALEQRVDAAIDAAVGASIVGCVVLLWQGGEPVYVRAAGLADREAGRAMTRDTIFRLASVTKPVVAAAVLRLAERGVLRLDDPVTRYLPEFTPLGPDGAQPEITIRQLLTHTSGLTYQIDDNLSSGLGGALISQEENMRRLAAMPLHFAPGTAWEYGMSLDVLGAVLAVLDGPLLGDALARLVTGPLGMTDTAFGVADPARLAAAYRDGHPPVRMGEPEMVVGEDGDVTPFSPMRIFQADAPHSGGAGLAGTAGDVMRLMEALRGNFLAGETRAMAFGNQVGDLVALARGDGKGFGFLGAVTLKPGDALPVGALDWGGAWGHNWVIDPAGGRSLVVCTNTAFNGCNGPFRAAIWEAVFG